jgi:hypothetical protein
MPTGRSRWETAPEEVVEMRKPEKCGMHVQHCESCEDWEPIPFHGNGGLCLRRGRKAHRQAADLVRQAAFSTRGTSQRPVGLT